MNIEYVKIKELQGYEFNTRTHSDSQVNQLAASIGEFGFTNPLLIDGERQIIAGHGRFAAATKLEMDEVPCIVLDHLSEAQRRAYVIADNKLALNAGWDEDLLKLELSALDKIGFDLTVVGFDADELSGLVIDEDIAGGLTDEDDVPEVTENPVSKVGDIWLLGEHRVMCGDSTNGGDVALLMNGEKADMVFTDPPYGMNLDTDYSKLKGTEKSPNAKGYKWDKVIGDDADFEFPTFYKHFESVKEQFWWGADYYFNKLPTGGGLMVWQKRDKADAEMIGNDFELCWSKQRHKKATFWKRWVGFDSIERGEKRVHPTQKPIDLAVWFYEKWGGKGDLIVDLFLGSGTALIAAEKKNRKCYGMELDPKYVDVIIKRWQEYTGKKAIHAETGVCFNEVADAKQVA